MKRLLKRTGLLFMAWMMVMVSVWAPGLREDVYAATGASLNAEEVELYAADKSYYDNENANLPAIPADKKSFQIRVSGATASSYQVTEGNSVTVSSTGLIEPVYETWYWQGGFGSTFKPADMTGVTVTSTPRFGDSTVCVNTNKGALYITVHVLDYAQIYADSVISDFIAENITDDMTIEEKVRAATRYVAETTDYGNYQSYIGMIIVGAGDCWASTNTIVKICTEMGLHAWGRNGNKDAGAGSGHRNAVIEGDGCYYVAEAGFGGTKPRGWYVEEVDDLFFVDCTVGEVDGGYLLAQYDGDNPNHTKLEIPTMVGDTPIVGLSESFSLRSNEYDVWEEVVIPEGIRILKAGSLQCLESLTSVRIPASVDTIEEAVFSDDSALTDITIDPANTHFKTADGAIYSIDGTQLVSAPSFSGPVIPDGVSSIENYAFSCNANVKSLEIPATVESIREGAFSRSGLTMLRFDGDMPDIGEYAFYGLDLVVYYPKDNDTWNTDGTYGANSIEWHTYNAGAVDLASCSASIPADRYVHEDDPIEPAVTVFDGDKELQKDVDYTVTYKNNDEVGTATVRLTGMGDYIGVKELSFAITPKLEFDKFVSTTLTIGEPMYYCGVMSEWAPDGQTIEVISSDPSIAEIELVPEYSDTFYKYFNIIPHKVGTVTIIAKDAYGAQISQTIKVVSDTGWIKLDGEWYYQKNGWIVWDTWVKDNGSWYYLGEDGRMVTSAWRKDSKGWCYLGSDGRMVTNGWAKDSKGWCWIGSNGYMLEKTQWVKAGDGEWYHITKGYRDQNKWMKDGSGWCYLGANGKMVRSTWKKDSKGWCYLGADGYMVTNGWAKDSKGWCWIGSNGYMPVATKWVSYDNGWYYIEKGYRVQNAWRKDSKGWCYLSSDGRMVTDGWAKDSKGWCWIGSNGYMVEETQWVDFEGDRYYIDKGYRVSGEREIDGVTYTFDEDGRLLTE